MQSVAVKRFLKMEGGYYISLFMILFAAVILRSYWLVTQTHAIESEGAEYASLARNLVRGIGYVGSLEGGIQLLFPPLYPILIAGASFISNNFETAGQIVSLTFGIALVITVSAIARVMYGPRVGLIAALVTALHPLLIALSAAVYSEGPYLTFVMGGIYCGLKIAYSKHLKYSIFAGICFGLAYLTRPEAVMLPFVLIVVSFIVRGLRNTNFGRLMLSWLTVVGAFSIVALPYIIFLSMEIGQIRIEGKGALNFTMAKRMNGGMSYGEASYGISDDLKEEGPVFKSQSIYTGKNSTILICRNRLESLRVSKA